MSKVSANDKINLNSNLSTQKNQNWLQRNAGNIVLGLLGITGLVACEEIIRRNCFGEKTNNNNNENNLPYEKDNQEINNIKDGKQEPQDTFNKQVEAWFKYGKDVTSKAYKGYCSLGSFNPITHEFYNNLIKKNVQGNNPISYPQKGFVLQNGSVVDPNARIDPFDDNFIQNHCMIKVYNIPALLEKNEKGFCFLGIILDLYLDGMIKIKSDLKNLKNKELKQKFYELSEDLKENIQILADYLGTDYQTAKLAYCEFMMSDVIKEYKFGLEFDKPDKFNKEKIIKYVKNKLLNERVYNYFTLLKYIKVCMDSYNIQCGPKVTLASNLLIISVDNRNFLNDKIESEKNYELICKLAGVINCGCFFEFKNYKDINAPYAKNYKTQDGRSIENLMHTFKVVFMSDVDYQSLKNYVNGEKLPLKYDGIIIDTITANLKCNVPNDQIIGQVMEYVKRTYKSVNEEETRKEIQNIIDELRKTL